MRGRRSKEKSSRGDAETLVWTSSHLICLLPLHCVWVDLKKKSFGGSTTYRNTLTRSFVQYERERRERRERERERRGKTSRYVTFRLGHL